MTKEDVVTALLPLMMGVTFPILMLAFLYVRTGVTQRLKHAWVNYA